MLYTKFGSLHLYINLIICKLMGWWLHTKKIKYIYLNTETVCCEWRWLVLTFIKQINVAHCAFEWNIGIWFCQRIYINSQNLVN